MIRQVVIPAGANAVVSHESNQTLITFDSSHDAELLDRVTLAQLRLGMACAREMWLRREARDKAAIAAAGSELFEAKREALALGFAID